MTKTEDKIAKLLIKNGKTLAVAESCTGGLISSLLTDVSGSSDYTKINFVTYSNDAKIKYLGVNPSTLEKYGAVSEQTAKEMVQGLIRNTHCDYALSTTGIAGPTGGTESKPVGLVYIGIAAQNKISVLKYNANPNAKRIEIKCEFASKALESLLNFLANDDKSI